MTGIINRQSLMLTLSLFICLGILNALRPVYGHSQEDELKKKVETLTQKTEEQKKALDALKTDFEKFKTAVVERDRNTRQLITQNGQRLNADAQNLGRVLESTRRHDGVLRQLTQELSQQRNAIVNINNRLRGKGI